jgi:hypothetical protein
MHLKKNINLFQCRSYIDDNSDDWMNFGMLIEAAANFSHEACLQAVNILSYSLQIQFLQILILKICMNVGRKARDSKQAIWTERQEEPSLGSRSCR